jgi:hypothetical protein
MMMMQPWTKEIGKKSMQEQEEKQRSSRRKDKRSFYCCRQDHGMQENIINSATKCGGGVLDSSLAAESSEVRYPQQEKTRKEKTNKKTKQKQ